MKRSYCALLTAAVVGCQTTNPLGSGIKTGSVTPPSQAAPNKNQYAAKTAPVRSDIQQVGFEQGYNQGHGVMQNNMFHQRVARAVPSHGGAIPGGPSLPGPGDPSYIGAGPGAAWAGGAGHSHGPGPGLHAGAACPPGAGPGLGGPGVGFGAPGVGDLAMGPRFVTGRSQVRFVRPTSMKIAWQSVNAMDADTFTPPQLEVPARYNFLQARIYRLKLSDIVNRPGLELYPTLEVYPGNAKVDAYLAHNAVPIEFTEEDFDQVQAGNFVTKVIYLPDPAYQELAIAGVETLVSTRLDPGVDPVQEANRRGAILAVVRLGGVDLEMPHSPTLFPPAPPVLETARTQGPTRNLPPSAPQMGSQPLMPINQMPAGPVRR